MKNLSTLAHWEHHVARAPRPYQMRLYFLCFIASLFFGLLLSWYLSYVRTSSIQKVALDIRELETSRMDERVRELRIKLARQ